MKPRILFVCLGNICRSPAAEAVFRARSDAPCDSAGTASWHVGKPPYAPMLRALERRGLNASDLRARRVTREDFETFDLILAMDPENLRDLGPLAPGVGKPRLLTSYIDDADGVPDPYYTRDFDAALDLIERSVTAMITAEGL